MRQLSIDIETYSSIDIKLGVYRYVDAPDFKYYCLRTPLTMSQWS